MNTDKITILYQRLSRDDPTNEGESNSIVHQRQMLEKFANDNGLTPYESISDDGYSGTGWHRPGWERVIELIEAGKVSCLCVKNLDRMGRDHLRVGLLLEQFEAFNVRFIAIANKIDSQNQASSEFAPFLNIMSEWYLRDARRKVKASHRARGMSRKRLTFNPIYGYILDPDDKSKWIVDPESAEVVSQIF
jgi:DNA invertase Pin-like site-specific DNA recombinase